MGRLVVSYLIAVSLIIGGLAVAEDSGPADSSADSVAVVTFSPLDGKAVIPIAVRAGQQFIVTLPSNKTTGYQWRLASKLDETAVALISSKYNDPSESIPGRGGSETWVFRGVGNAKASFALEYVRPWEKDVEPAKKQVFSVSVF